MSLVGPGRLLKLQKSRTFVHVSQDVVKDSQFPFKHGDSLRVTIDTSRKRLIVEAAD